LGFRGSGRFLDRRSVCGLGLSALTFQAQFDEVLPKLAVVHANGNARREAGALSWHDTDAAYATFPRYLVWEAILAEDKVPWALPPRRGHQTDCHQVVIRL